MSLITKFFNHENYPLYGSRQLFRRKQSNYQMFAMHVYKCDNSMRILVQSIMLMMPVEKCFVL